MLTGSARSPGLDCTYGYMDMDSLPGPHAHPTTQPSDRPRPPKAKGDYTKTNCTYAILRK
jgi:hypothetical protein